MPDSIDEAIAVTEGQAQIEMIQRVWRLSTGRPFVVQIPSDMSDDELREAAGHMSIIGWAQIAQNRKPTGPKLLIPTGVPLLRQS